jgi:hypothetical protein
LRTVQFVGHAEYEKSIRNTANRSSTNAREDMVEIEKKVKMSAHNNIKKVTRAKDKS